ncbi:formate dehydrogenase subunit delta [Parasphingopyxis marina]|uniref:Formate dehydrogenase subunit delta n=1 Tax=Parasphingopyxis marina TaxID=2761622 RepID=A0A842I3I9_9SPHN|nr:formate dehydrogenase subunit delta [Parasphingopyxis marina]MBC2778574.1 formate dehydrogenase subunit delta [Parasphingopyxis marina]
MNSLEHLVYMANQIARNFATMNDVDASAAVADHIASFWDPRMKQMIFDYLDDDGQELSPVAHSAIVQLQSKGAPPPQTRATEFNAVDEGGRSDAG